MRVHANLTIFGVAQLMNYHAPSRSQAGLQTPDAGYAGRALKPQKLLELAAASRAACATGTSNGLLLKVL